MVDSYKENSWKHVVSLTFDDDTFAFGADFDLGMSTAEAWVIKNKVSLQPTESIGYTWT